jgi:PAS domain-containing protein
LRLAVTTSGSAIRVRHHYSLNWHDLVSTKILHDLTEQRDTEEKLRESEERLRVALSAGAMGTCRWRIPQDEQILDDSLSRPMGLPPNSGVLAMDEFLRAVHPEDRGRVRLEFERCEQEESDLNVEFRVTCPDGSVHWLKDQGKTLTGPEGLFRGSRYGPRATRPG